MKVNFSPLFPKIAVVILLTTGAAQATEAFICSQVSDVQKMTHDNSCFFTPGMKDSNEAGVTKWCADLTAASGKKFTGLTYSNFNELKTAGYVNCATLLTRIKSSTGAAQATETFICSQVRDTQKMTHDNSCFFTPGMKDSNEAGVTKWCADLTAASGKKFTGLTYSNFNELKTAGYVNCATLLTRIKSVDFRKGAEGLEVNCSLKVHGKTHLNGTCIYDADKDGSFRLFGDKYFVYLNVLEKGVASASWNGTTPQASHADDLLGEDFKRKGGCWIGKNAEICVSDKK